MSLRVLVDMNLSPEWVAVLQTAGWPAIHGSAVGNPRAADAEIMEWARNHEHLVLTHDLNFSTVLALTHERGPSVLQVRGRAVLPEGMAPVVLAAIRRYEQQLAAGALVVVDAVKSRVRLLPL